MTAIWHYFRNDQSEILHWLWTTLWLAAIPVLAGLAISLPIGWAASRFRWTYPPLVSISGLLYTIPSIVLFLVLPGILGTGILDPVNVAVALTVYCVALLVRVIADGLSSVDEITLAAASAMGYTNRQRLLAVQLPLAVPVIGAACGSRPCRTSAWSRWRRRSASPSSDRCSPLVTTCPRTSPRRSGSD